MGFCGIYSKTQLYSFGVWSINSTLVSLHLNFHNTSGNEQQPRTRWLLFFVNTYPWFYPDTLWTFPRFRGCLSVSPSAQSPRASRKTGHWLPQRWSQWSIYHPLLCIEHSLCRTAPAVDTCILSSFTIFHLYMFSFWLSFQFYQIHNHIQWCGGKTHLLYSFLGLNSHCYHTRMWR